MAMAFLSFPPLSWRRPFFLTAHCLSHFLWPHGWSEMCRTNRAQLEVFNVLLLHSVLLSWFNSCFWLSMCSTFGLYMQKCRMRCIWKGKLLRQISVQCSSCNVGSLPLECSIFSKTVSPWPWRTPLWPTKSSCVAWLVTLYSSLCASNAHYQNGHSSSTSCKGLR